MINKKRDNVQKSRGFLLITNDLPVKKISFEICSNVAAHVI